MVSSTLAFPPHPTLSEGPFPTPGVCRSGGVGGKEMDCEAPTCRACKRSLTSTPGPAATR